MILVKLYLWIILLKQLENETIADENFIQGGLKMIIEINAT